MNRVSDRKRYVRHIGISSGGIKGKNAGGTFKNTEVLVEGNLVTSRTWMDLPFLMREFLKVLRAAEKSAAAKR